MSAAACDADDPYGLDYVAILCRCARGAFGLHAEIEAEIHAEIEAEIEALEKGERHTCMQSARNQHAIITRSELNQHAISMPSTCNQHAISLQSACNRGPRERPARHTSHLTRSIALHLGAGAAAAARRRRTGT